MSRRRATRSCVRVCVCVGNGRTGQRKLVSDALWTVSASYCNEKIRASALRSQTLSAPPPCEFFISPPPLRPPHKRCRGPRLHVSAVCGTADMNNTHYQFCLLFAFDAGAASCQPAFINVQRGRARDARRVGSQLVRMVFSVYVIDATRVLFPMCPRGGLQRRCEEAF